MMKWLEGMLEEAECVDKKRFNPVQEVGTGEQVVGTVDSACKKLYALGISYKEKGDGAFDQEMRQFLGHKIPKMVRCRESSGVLYGKGRAVMDVFWASIRDALGLWGKDIGIRKGWKIVLIKKEKSADVPPRYDFSKTFTPRH